jgi:hypothetical protein
LLLLLILLLLLMLLLLLLILLLLYTQARTHKEASKTGYFEKRVHGAGALCLYSQQFVHRHEMLRVIISRNSSRYHLVICGQCLRLHNYYSYWTVFCIPIINFGVVL